MATTRTGAGAAPCNVGSGKRRGEQQERGNACREQEQIAQPPAIGALDRRSAQQTHGGERDFRGHVAPQQVQRDRNRDGQRAEQEGRIEEGHSLSPGARRQVPEQREIERLGGVEQPVVDAGSPQVAFVPLP